MTKRPPIPSVRALAEQAEAVLSITMYHSLATGWADLVLPATSYLERDGTVVNLEESAAASAPRGRVSRSRRARLDLEAGRPFRRRALASCLSRLRPACRAPLSRPGHCGARRALAAPAAFGVRATRARRRAIAPSSGRSASTSSASCGSFATGRFFSGPYVERVPELEFQRAEAEVDLSPADAERQSIATGDLVDVRSNGTSVALRARIDRRLVSSRPDGRGARRRSAPARRGGARVTQLLVLASAGDAGEPWWIAVIEALVVVNLVLFTFAYLTLARRKVMKRMQLQYRPNPSRPVRLAPADRRPAQVDPQGELLSCRRGRRTVHLLAVHRRVRRADDVLRDPVPARLEIAGYQVNGYVADVPIALILIFAIGSLEIYGFIVGGWASDSKYSLLGSMRTCAQLVSYEVSLALSVLGVVIMAQSLSLVDVVAAQESDGIWYVVPQFVGFLAHHSSRGRPRPPEPRSTCPRRSRSWSQAPPPSTAACCASGSSRCPSINLITLSALCVTLFLGGWHWFFWESLGPLLVHSQALRAVFLFIWMRTTLPRLRYDQLMRFGWKVLLPLRDAQRHRDGRPGGLALMKAR